MNQPSAQLAPTNESDLEAAVDDAIATCDGDERATVRALMVANMACQAELQALQTEVDAIVAQLSLGYTRGRYGSTR